MTLNQGTIGSKYKIEDMKETYEKIYREAAQRTNLVWEDKETVYSL